MVVFYQRKNDSINHNVFEKGSSFMKSSNVEIVTMGISTFVNIIVLRLGYKDEPFVATAVFAVVVLAELIVLYLASCKTRLKEREKYDCKISVLKKEINDNCSLIQELNERIYAYKNLDNDANGNNLLYMALTQDPAEPLKISLLEKSAHEFKNSMAAIILAYIYRYGLEKNGVVVIEKNLEKSFELYNEFSSLDISGVCAWQVGWHYQQKALAIKSDSKEREELFSKARTCFELSRTKGFPKAENSIANLIRGSKAGFDYLRDIATMLSLYENASQKGDYYATLNSAHFYYDEYNRSKDIHALICAKERYKIAESMNAPEGALHVGMVNLELNKIKEERAILEEAVTSICACIMCGENEFSAVAYCLLGNLISRYPEFTKTTAVSKIVSDTPHHKACVECYERGYRIFIGLMEQGKVISDSGMKYFNLLTKSFENIVTPLLS